VLAPKQLAWWSGREAAYYACALAGSGLTVAVGLLYRIDLVKRGNWPSMSTGWISAVVFLAALGLLTMAWIGLAQLCRGRTLLGQTLPDAQRPTATRIVLMGLLVNLAAMITPPFLSDDSLAYAAIGRAIGTYHQPMYMPLGEALPQGDPFRELISQYPLWLSSGSAYNPAFNWIACGVNYLAGENLNLQLRLFQLVGLLAMLLATLVTGKAAREAPLEPLAVPNSAATPQPAPSVAGWRAIQAMALVIFCPLTVIEATANAHNDSLLALSVALFALCVVRQHRGGALAALVAGVMVKTSGVLLLGLYLVHRLATKLGTRLPRLAGSRMMFIGIAITAVLTTATVVWLLGPWLVRHSSHVARVLGSTVDKYPYCTRSIESAPRAVLHIVLGLPTAAWCVGLAFRAAAGALLLYMAIQSPPGVRHLSWAAGFIFFFYLYFNAYSQPWYVLSLLPLLTFADPRLRPAMLALPISNLASYSMYFPLDGNPTILVRALSEISQVLIVIAPPTMILWACWCRSRAANSGVSESECSLLRGIPHVQHSGPRTQLAQGETGILG
jgi:hypothetical protein